MFAAGQYIGRAAPWCLVLSQKGSTPKSTFG